MWEEVLTKALTVAGGVVAYVLVALVLAALRRRYDAEASRDETTLDEYLITSTIDQVVRAVEMIAAREGWASAQKLFKALEEIKKRLDEQGIARPSDNWLRVLIESAVLGLRAQGLEIKREGKAEAPQPG